jgi:CDC45-like protein
VYFFITPLFCFIFFFLLQAYLGERLSNNAYQSLYKILYDEVRTLNTENENPNRFNSNDESNHDRYNINDNGDEDVSGKASAGLRGYIMPSVEPRFVSHRFWNLYDAMYNSEYISTRLDTYRVEDERTSKSRLDALLAQTGVRLDVIKQPWNSVPSEDRAKVISKLKGFALAAATLSAGGPVSSDDVGWDVNGAARLDDATSTSIIENFDINTNMFYRSFVFSLDMEPEMAAADVVNAINGMLCCGDALPALLEHVKSGLGMESLVNGQVSATNYTLSGNLAANNVGPGTDVLRRWAAGTSWKAAWLHAWEALSRRSLQTLMGGIRQQQELRHAMLRLGSSIIRADRVTKGKTVRSVVIDDDVMNDFDRRVFTTPIALAALGRFLIKLYRDSQRRWRTRTGAVSPMPFILFVAFPHAATGRRWLTVHGLPVGDEGDDIGGTNFFEVFDDAARLVNAQFIMDSFDSASMLLDVDHKAAFLDALDPP